MTENLTMAQIALSPIMVPAQPFSFPRPISYNFRVVETVQDGKITSVRLQTQKLEHDASGIPIARHDWEDVPRLREELK